MLNTIPLKYYMIMREDDQTEGRGSRSETGIAFENHSAALQFTKSKHMANFTVMGYVNESKGHDELIRLKQEPRIYESFVEYEKENSILVKKQKALDKLTKEEKEILRLI